MSEETSSLSSAIAAVKSRGLLGYRKNFLVDKPYQLKAAVTLVALVLVLLGFVNYALYSASLASAAQLLTESPELAEMIRGQERRQAILIIAGSLVFLGGVFAVSILETHKTAGAAYNIEMKMGDVELGHYAARVRLRKGDNLRGLEDSFNRMGAALEQRTRQDAESLQRLASELDRAKDLVASRQVSAEIHRIAERQFARLD
ncbi:MAG: hypothetical protein GY716_05055 [bacterium]|nr:hypothetical protein [bacterium]